jgi:hypothetical protein
LASFKDGRKEEALKSLDVSFLLLSSQVAIREAAPAAAEMRYREKELSG